METNRSSHERLRIPCAIPREVSASDIRITSAFALLTQIGLHEWGATLADRRLSLELHGRRDGSLGSVRARARFVNVTCSSITIWPFSPHRLGCACPDGARTVGVVQQ